MSSTIVHDAGYRPTMQPPSEDEDKHPFLVALGERVRALRARRGMTRKALSLARRRLRAPPRQPRVRRRQCLDPGAAAGGAGAAVLAGRAARRRDHVVARMAADPRAAGAARRGDAAPRARGDRRDCSAPAAAARAPQPRIALIGLRGAGKSTLGQHAGRGPGLSVRRAERARSRSSPAAASPRSRRCTARTPTAATSGARSRRRSRSTPRR